MSLCIDSRYITGIYALGQWFNVKPDTIDVDSYQFTNWKDQSPHDGNRFQVEHTDFEMGDVYPQNDPSPVVKYRADSAGYSSGVGPYHGIAFIDADTGERVSFCLLEVRAFRERRKAR